jgi:hypothetical protein
VVAALALIGAAENDEVTSRFLTFADSVWPKPSGKLLGVKV